MYLPEMRVKPFVVDNVGSKTLLNPLKVGSHTGMVYLQVSVTSRYKKILSLKKTDLS